MENFAKTFVSNMANGDIFYSRLSFGTIQQQFFGIFQFLKGGEFFLPPPGSQGEKKTLVLKGLKVKPMIISCLRVTLYVFLTLIKITSLKLQNDLLSH